MSDQPSMDEVVREVIRVLCREGLTTAATVLNVAWSREMAAREALRDERDEFRDKTEKLRFALKGTPEIAAALDALVAEIAGRRRDGCWNCQHLCAGRCAVQSPEGVPLPRDGGAVCPLQCIKPPVLAECSRCGVAIMCHGEGEHHEEAGS